MKNLKDKHVVIEGRNYEYSEIVMLATNKHTVGGEYAVLLGDSGKLYSPQAYTTSFKPQHLYFLSTDKICIGDWVVEYQKGDTIGEVHFIKSEYVISQDIQYKIIASTDSSLNLPKPSEQFLQVYIDAYNQNNKLEECLVEYVKISTDEYGNYEYGFEAYIPKVTDGEIIIINS